MTAAAQIRRVSGVHLRCGGLATVRAKHQRMLQCRAGRPQAKTTAAQRMIDHFFKQAHHPRGIRHAQHTARSEVKIAHQRGSSWTGEVEEILHHRLLRRAADHMRHAGVVKKRMPGLNLMLAVRQRRAAFAARDEFKGQEWELLAIHHEIRCTPLTTAAHEAERGLIAASLLPCGEKEAPRAHHLRGKVVSLVGGGHARSMSGSSRIVKPLPRMSSEG